MENFDPNPFTIYLWHQPEDKVFAHRLADGLRSRKFDVAYLGEKEDKDELSFHASEWQMAKSDCVLFLISESAIKSPYLQTDAEKVMRRKNVFLIPAYIDDLNTNEVPLLLQYIYSLEFYRDYSKGFETLITLIHRKLYGKRVTLRDAKSVRIKPLAWMIEHFRRYLTLSPLTFCWQITVENLVISLAVTGLIYLIWQPIPRTNLENLTASSYLWTIIILGPIVETVLLQALPILVARFLGLKFFGQLLFSIIPFAALHFTRSIGAGIGAGIIGGFYSAFTYAHWQSKSTWTAFWVTAFSHCLYNLALFAMLIGEF